MRHTTMGFALVTLLGLAACSGGGEYIPSLKPVGDGVPSDLPALGADEAAVLRLRING